MKKSIIHNNIIYYNLITPYGYSGYYYNKQETYNEFFPLFREKAKKLNYIEEIVRQNPYLNINLTNYDIIKTKLIYGINTVNFDDYYKYVLNTKKRNMYNKAINNNYKFEIVNFKETELINTFIDMYSNTMNKLNANKYYYFNNKYFQCLQDLNLDNIKLALVKDDKKKIIGQSIIFIYNKFIHYHLSCNDCSSNCITDFLLINIVKNYKDKLIIMGGGLVNNDSLSNFKKKLNNKEFTYSIFKNVLNKEISDNL